MSTVVDGVLKEWGDRLYYTNVKARPAPKTVGKGKAKNVAPKARPVRNVRATLARTVKRVPEVLVKISGGGKDMSRIKAHLDYISRNGDVPLEDEQGRLIEGKEAVRELRDDWKDSGGKAIPYEGGYRREAFNIVLSMPPGTDPDAVREAAAEFAKATFGNHQYVFAAHNDEAHPHVHLCVKAVSLDMVRLNPRKADLQEWREMFAEKLRDNGIEANATARAPRGRTRRAERQAVRHIQARGAESTAKRGRAAAVDAELREAKGREHPAEAKIRAKRRSVVESYGAIAKALADSPGAADKNIAVAIVNHVRRMEPPKTEHRLAVDLVQSGAKRSGVGRGQSQEKGHAQAIQPGRGDESPSR